MSKESAELLAQVIPVVALALGLEVRHLMSSAAFREFRSVFDSSEQPSTLPRSLGTWIGVIASLCFLLFALLLALAEVYALDVVAGRRFTPLGDWTSDFGANRIAEWINFVIVFTFAAAPMAALYKAISAPLLSRKPDLLLVLLPALPLGTFLAYLVMRTVFWWTLT
jgi:hypothetical protein